jgi:transglutaminase-like putative cysteine protease
MSVSHSVSSILFLFSLFLWLTPTLSFAQSPDAELVKQRTSIEAWDGKITTVNSYIIRINNRNGDKYAQISIPFDKLNRVSDIEASLSDAAGNRIRDLKRSEIIERSAPSDISFYEDAFVKEFSMRHSEYPYTLSYSYCTTATQYMYIDWWCPVLSPEIPTLDAELSVSIDSGYQIHTLANLVSEPDIRNLTEEIRYVWHTNWKSPYEPEDLAPSDQELLPSVRIVPDRFHYETDGSTENWKAYCDWQLSLLKGLNDLSPPDVSFIQNRVKDIPDPKEKARAIFHYLQENTHYVNVTVKTGGLKPYPASYVASRKYGDCKALTNYYLACLEAAGLRGCYTNINAGGQIEPIDEQFPAQQFNHVIACLPLTSDTLWVDCTSKLAFGYLGTFDQGRTVVVTDPENSRLTRTPSLTNEDVAEIRSIRISFDESGLVKGDFRETYRGRRYEALASMRKGLSETELAKQIRNNWICRGFQTGAYSLVQTDRDKPSIGLNYSAEALNLMKNYGRESLFQTLPVDIPVLREPKFRKLPVQISYPLNRTDSVTYIISAFHSLIDMPADTTVRSGYGEYSIRSIRSEKDVLVIKHFQLAPGRIPLTEYPAFYSFIQSIRAIDDAAYLTLIKRTP